ncbi:MAG: helix-turn-helix transcriptional regulator [Clostridia bacterium]|nr:helix-turn-helix transcriptional regulator [Clostridia bacterium]MBQ8446344.1 helix-turn-helix transcriptional regulator [Clostridia bacterium]
MKFFERLALELKGCKLTQKQIAQELGIDSSNITKWKNGEYLPSLDIFYKLCNLLDVSADYLLGLID